MPNNFKLVTGIEKSCDEVEQLFKSYLYPVVAITISSPTFHPPTESDTRIVVSPGIAVSLSCVQVTSGSIPWKSQPPKQPNAFEPSSIPEKETIFIQSLDTKLH